MSSGTQSACWLTPLSDPYLSDPVSRCCCLIHSYTISLDGKIITKMPLDVGGIYTVLVSNSVSRGLVVLAMRSMPHAPAVSSCDGGSSDSRYISP